MKTAERKKELIVIISIICVIATVAGCLALFTGAKKNKLETPADKSTTIINEEASEVTENNKINTISTTAKADSPAAKKQTNSTTAAAKSNKAPEKKTGNVFLEATQNDINKLGTSKENTNSWLNRMRYSIEMDTVEFSKMSAEDFWNNYFIECSGKETSSLYSYYFDDAEIIETSEHPDPKSLFDPVATGDGNTGFYVKYKAENVEWIMKEIFGITPTRDFKNPHNEYYHNGYYYCIQSYNSTDDFVRYTVSNYHQLADGRYEINVEGWHLPADMVGYKGTIIAGIKNIDGVRQWVFYKTSFSELPLNPIHK